MVLMGTYPERQGWRMRSLWPFVIVSIICIPALGAGQTQYTFDVISGGFSVDVLPNNFVTPDPTYVPVAGWFEVTINDADGQLGAGDTFTLGNANIYNSEAKVMSFVGHPGTATFAAGSTSICGFQCGTPGQISGACVGSIDPNIHVVTHLTVVGCTGWDSWMNGTWDYDTWKRVDVRSMTLDFDVVNGVPVSVTLDGELLCSYFYNGYAVGSFSQGFEVKAAVIPEPASTGLLGLGAIVLTYGRFHRRRG